LLFDQADDLFYGLRNRPNDHLYLLSRIRESARECMVAAKTRTPEALLAKELEVFSHIRPVLYPNEQQRLQILKGAVYNLTFYGLVLDATVDLEEIAKSTEWWSVRELNRLIGRVQDEDPLSQEALRDTMAVLGRNVALHQREKRMKELLRFTVEHCTDIIIREGLKAEFSALLEEEVSDITPGVPQPPAGILISIKEFNVANQKIFRDVKGSVIGEHVHDIDFTQLWNEVGSRTDLNALSNELAKLREEMLKQAKTAEHHAAIGAVASAQIQAEKGYGEKAFEYLSNAGKWALDTATQIGVRVAALALKESLGIK
jgi:hypothetical protein